MEQRSVPLFYPFVAQDGVRDVQSVLNSRWVGQGPRVDEFEHMFAQRLGGEHRALAVGSGTDALHLSYILAGLGPGDEVITPVFTCTATNIPLRYLGATPVFADVDPQTMNIDVQDAARRVTERTKAIVCVHYGGYPCDMPALRELSLDIGVPLIEDCAHALGGRIAGTNLGAWGDFGAFSFQAVKHITTGDGGMLTVLEPEAARTGMRLRWFGIDRESKFDGVWENDISEVGFKYQMTDIGAAMGIAGLRELDHILEVRRNLAAQYDAALGVHADVKLIGRSGLAGDSSHANWAYTIAVANRVSLQTKLRSRGVECGQVHYRNDRYSIFGGRRDDLPAMDAIEDQYLVLPLNTHITESDVEYICDVVKDGW